MEKSHIITKIYTLYEKKEKTTNQRKIKQS